MHPALEVIYHVRSDARSIEERAQAIAIEQSVEMPLSAITDAFVRAEIVGRVCGIEEKSSDLFEVRISLAGETIGSDPGQLINMLFGNTSLHRDIALHDVELPGTLVTACAGPRHGLHALRQRVGAPARALTCSALKPQGLSADKLAALAARFAQGGIDYIKDDHGLADQAYSRFAARVEAVAAALRGVGQPAAQATRYVPSLSGDLDTMRAPDRARARRRRRYRHGGPDGRWPRQFSLPGARASRMWRSSRIRHGGGRDRAAAPVRQAVPDAGRRCGHLPQPWRAVRLFARHLSGPGRDRPCGIGTDCARPCRCRPAA